MKMDCAARPPWVERKLTATLHWLCLVLLVRAATTAPLEEKPSEAVLRLGRAGLAHLDNVSCAAFSPDGKTLATGGHDRYVRLWDPETGRERQALRHLGWVRSLVWAPDGKTLYSSSDNEGVRLWDVATGTELRRLGDRQGMVTALALTADGNTLAWSVESTTVVVQDVVRDRELFRFTVEERAYRLAFAPDGQALLVGGERKKIRRWQVPSGKELPALEGHVGGTYPVVFSRDGKRIASGGSHLDAAIHVWDAATGKEVRRWPSQTHAVGALAFSPDGTTLLSGHSSVPDTLRLWDVATGRLLRSFPAPAHGLVDSLAFSPDGKRAVSAGCWGRGVYLWDVQSGKEVSPFARHHDGVTALAFSPDGKSLVTGSADHTLALWETEQGRQVGRYRGHGGRVRAVAVAPDGKLVASVAEDQCVRLWFRSTQETVRELTSGKMDFACVAFSPDGQVVAAGGGEDSLRLPGGARAPDCAVHLWNVSTGKEAWRLEGKGGRVNALTFSADGRILATTGHDDRAIHLWDPQTGQERGRLEHATESGASPGLFEGTTALAFSPDGRTLAAVSFYEYKSNRIHYLPPRENDVRTVTLWEIASGKVRHEVRLPRNSVRAAIFLDDRHLVLGCQDGTLRPLDVATSRWLPAVRGHHDAVATLALAPDARTFASGSSDTTALVWRSTAVAASRPLQKTAREGAALREHLVGLDAVRAHQAVWELATMPESVRLLENLVRPVPTVTAKHIKELIGNLDSEQFKVREKATAELQTLRDVAGPPLSETLRHNPSPEVRRRVEGLLERLTGHQAETVPTRVLEVLERLGTSEAHQLLETVAQGASGAWLTRAAKAALKRLSRQRPAAP